MFIDSPCAANVPRPWVALCSWQVLSCTRDSHTRLASCSSLLRLPSQSTTDWGWRGLKHRPLFPPLSGGWESETRVSAGLVPPEAALLGVSMPSPLCVRTWSPLCVCVLLPSSYKDTVRWDQGPSSWPRVTFLTSLKPLSPNTVTF